jgi:hypothetical protein
VDQPSKSNRSWIWLIVIGIAAVIVFAAVKQTEARRNAIRGQAPNQVDFSR